MRQYRFRIRAENCFGVSEASPVGSTSRDDSKAPRGTPSPQPYTIDRPKHDGFGEAPRFYSEKEAVYGIDGQPLALDTYCYGYPKPQSQWFFRGQPVVAASVRQRQGPSGLEQLALEKITARQCGLYECVAKNEHGEARCALT